MGVTVILGEEFAGPHATSHLPLVIALNLPWLLVPIFLTLRMWKEHPFTGENSSELFATLWKLGDSRRRI